MKKDLLKTVIATGIIISSFACNKNDETPAPHQPPAKMVKKLVASESDFISYSFNTNMDLVEYNAQWQSAPDHITVSNFHYEYDGNKLVRFSNSGGHMEYQYYGGRIVSSENFAADGRKLSTHEFTYDNKNRVTTLIEIIASPEDIAQLKIQLEYYTDGNLKKMTHMARKTGSQQFEVNFSQFFETYDNKPQPIADLLLGHYLPGHVLHKNNPVKVRTLLPDGSTERILHMEYQYDEQGYPVTRDQRVEINGVMKPSVRYTYIY